MAIRARKRERERGSEHIHHLADRIKWTPHHQEARQLIDEHGAHPGRHRVRLRRTEVDVQHQHRHADAASRKKKKKERESKRERVSVSA